ncbi:hypothetical protein HG531_002570 [Fusarium graminearum]|nr:hypothetical protein HG531_002570 [Fusarium graminearum]
MPPGKQPLLSNAGKILNQMKSRIRCGHSGNTHDMVQAGSYLALPLHHQPVVDLLRIAEVSTVGVTGELNLLGSGQLEDLLEAASDRQENLLTLLSATALTAGNITFTSARNALSYGASPDADTEECLTDVDNNSHNFAIIFVLKSLADSAHHNLEPQTIDIDVALVLILSDLRESSETGATLF